ncbi:MAG: CDP-alcohol phosphatidyltransferase [candidate division WS6 bacterium 36_33]|uniref:CDP-alcohol phosphatidyltransferase n=1 Tax=candidate division WS6 bacterium 36_33 TaxID=1641388 RepID=A0A117LU34_9BACT|nr:MAG: CDP-alcohol phosphatidyltransferase [candidate division WS6 bacterium 36_33]
MSKKHNRNKQRLTRINKFFKEGNFQGVVDEIKDWLEEIRTGEIVFDLENSKVVYKRDSQQAINTAITAKAEERLKEIICPRIPSWISPDHLTLIGVIGIIIVSIGFVFGFINRYYLGLVPLGLIINWFGDSFDGSIARYRKRTRPNYGYYIDKIVDAVVMIILGLGLGLSGFVKIEIAILLTAIYLAMMINVDLLVYVKGEAKNSFGWFGPTEFRIIGIIIAIVMFFLPVKSYDIYGYLVTQYDIVILALSVLMFLILISEIIKNGIRLNKEDTKDW